MSLALMPILKYRFYYYSSMVRPMDQEETAFKKIVCYSQLPSGVFSPHIRCRATQGRPKVCQEAEGRPWQEPLLWFLGEETGEAG